MDMENGADIFTLTDEDGVEQEFELIDTLEEGGITYYALVPYYENAADMIEDSEALVLLKADIDEDSGEEILVTIDDEEEYNRIGQIFMDDIQNSYDAEE